MKHLFEQLLEDSTPRSKRIASYIGHPTPVDASPIERLRELRAHRNQICVYTKYLQQDAKVFHLLGDNKSKQRLLQKPSHNPFCAPENSLGYNQRVSGASKSIKTFPYANFRQSCVKGTRDDV